MDAEQQARAASSLLGDETFKGIMSELKQDFISGWTATNPDDVDGREEMYFAYLGLLHIENCLQKKLNAVKIDEYKAKINANKNVQEEQE